MRGKEGLPELREITIDRDKPLEARLSGFLGEVGDPAAFRVGDVAVKLVFDPRGRSFTQALAGALTAG